jgi:heme A synthase
MYGSLVLPIVWAFLRWQELRPFLTNWVDVDRGIAVIVGISFLVFVLLIWLVARRRKGWARYALAALLVVGLQLSLGRVYLNSSHTPLDLPLEIAVDIMQLVALVLVFTGNARDWFMGSAPTLSTL